MIICCRASGAGRPPGLLQERLLGSVEVRVDGVLTRWNGERGRSVLRYLLSRRQHAGTPAVYHIFWGRQWTDPMPKDSRRQPLRRLLESPLNQRPLASHTWENFKIFSRASPNRKQPASTACSEQDKPVNGAGLEYRPHPWRG
jgi:hypothetical protein